MNGIIPIWICFIGRSKLNYLSSALASTASVPIFTQMKAMAALKNPSHGCMFVSLVHLRHLNIQSRKFTLNNEIIITSLLHAVQQHMCIVIITTFPRVSQERSCRSCHHNRDTANDRCRSCWIHGDTPWTPILQDRLRSTHQRWVQEAILQELVRYLDLKTINFAISIFER